MIEGLQSLTIEAFWQKFATVQKCADYIASIKWANGFSCTQCGHSNYCKGSKYGDRQCTRCNKIESVTANTLFHSMKVPLDKALFMLYLIVTDKKGCPSTQLARQTGLQQKTCWLFHQKAMAAMASNNIHPLEGDVDIVLTTVNVMNHNQKGQKTTKQVKVLVGIEKKGRGAARTYVKVIRANSKKSVQAFICQKVDDCAVINMDDAVLQRCSDLQPLNSEGLDKALDHRVITTMINWLYTRHGHVTYLQQYLDEYCYRYNRHRMKGEIMDDIISRMVWHKPMMRKLSAN